MSNLQAIADRFEIEALRGEFTDAGMMHDYDRLASLFTEDGVVRIPDINAEAISREEIRARVERLQGLWDYFVQTTHPGTIQLEGNTAIGRAYISELGRLHDGRSELNYGVYHDRYQRTEDGWKFAERVYEVRYRDTTRMKQITLNMFMVLHCCSGLDTGKGVMTIMWFDNLFVLIETFMGQ